jgi:hypothetical protein
MSLGTVNCLGYKYKAFKRGEARNKTSDDLVYNKFALTLMLSYKRPHIISSCGAKLK